MKVDKDVFIAMFLRMIQSRLEKEDYTGET
jgi:hypothetical protein